MSSWGSLPAQEGTKTPKSGVERTEKNSDIEFKDGVPPTNRRGGAETRPSDGLNESKITASKSLERDSPHNSNLSLNEIAYSNETSNLLKNSFDKIEIKNPLDLTTSDLVDKSSATKNNLGDNTKGHKEPSDNVDNRNPENSRISFFKDYMSVSAEVYS